MGDRLFWRGTVTDTESGGDSTIPCHHAAAGPSTAPSVAPTAARILASAVKVCVAERYTPLLSWIHSLSWTRLATADELIPSFSAAPRVMTPSWSAKCSATSLATVDVPISIGRTGCGGGSPCPRVRWILPAER